MNTLLAFVLACLLNALWQVPVLAGCAWLMDRMLRRAEALRHRAWVTAWLLAVALPALAQWSWLRQRISLPGAGLRQDIHVRLLAGSPPGGSAHLPGPFASLLALAYLCVSLGFALRLLLSLRGTAALLRTGLPAPLAGPAGEAWALCRERFCLPSVMVLTTQRLAAPAACGLRAPVILLPERLLTEGSAQDLLAALAHESAHVERRDFRRNLLYELLAVPVAWHPAAWLLRSGIARSRELLCDRLALERLGACPRPVAAPALSLAPRDYADALLRLSSAAARPLTQTTAVGILDGNILEIRIMAILRPRKTLRPAAHRLLLLGAACLLASATAVTTSYALKVQTGEPGAAAGTIYTPGNGVTGPKVTSSVEPSFPKGVRVSKTFSGTAVIGIVVDRNGVPRDPHVLHSLTPAFDRQAMNAVRKYRFEPATKNGRPVAVAIRIEFHFQRF